MEPWESVADGVLSPAPIQVSFEPLGHAAFIPDVSAYTKLFSWDYYLWTGGLINAQHVYLFLKEKSPPLCPSPPLFLSSSSLPSSFPSFPWKKRVRGNRQIAFISIKYLDFCMTFLVSVYLICDLIHINQKNYFWWKRELGKMLYCSIKQTLLFNILFRNYSSIIRTNT